LDLGIVAKRTTGFSGASLANLLNEAAIVAARKDATEIGYEQIDYAIDRVTVGMQKTTGTNFPARQRLVAYHEAGHAVMGLLTPDYDLVTKVTVIPRTNGAGGFTLFTPSEERLESGMYSKRYLQSQVSRLTDALSPVSRQRKQCFAMPSLPLLLSSLTRSAPPLHSRSWPSPWVGVWLRRLRLARTRSPPEPREICSRFVGSRPASPARAIWKRPPMEMALGRSLVF
jgi:SpoVK/Ycf46/Vps4 family AAA+-type ATPase